MRAEEKAAWRRRMSALELVESLANVSEAGWASWRRSSTGLRSRQEGGSGGKSSEAMAAKDHGDGTLAVFLSPCIWLAFLA